MSVIAAMVYPEKIVMAADSIMVKDWSKSTSGDFSKINEDNGVNNPYLNAFHSEVGA